LFAGIGGMSISAEMAGFKTIGQCEFADYQTKILEKHWPTVPRWKDVRDVNAKSVKEKGIKGITIISGGFPCQPFSKAGKHKGKDDDRYLWPEMFRVIKELRPTWVLGENVIGVTKMALDTVLFDLENEGYSTRTFIIPACSINAPHRRDRVFIVGWDSNSVRCIGNKREEQKISNENSNSNRICNTATGIEWSRNQWEIEPNVDRVVDGIPSRVDRLKCLVNAVVPAQVYPIFESIAKIELQNT